MKFVFSLLCMLGALATFAQNPIDGNWKGSVETPNGPLELNYTFKVEGTVLKGTVKSEFGEIPIDSGKVEGKKFSYSITFGDMTIKSTGELISDDEILIKNDRGDMKLTRVKDAKAKLP